MTIAILLVASVLVINYNVAKSSPGAFSNDKSHDLLYEISKTPELRTAVLQDDLDAVYNFVNPKIPSNLNKELKICELGSECMIEDSPNTDVFATSWIITTDINNPEFSPRRLKIFVWENEQ